MSGDPADIGGAPVDVILFHVKDITVSGGSADEVTSTGVHHALRFAGRAAGVEDVEHVFGVHGLSLTAVAGLGHEIVPPEITPRLHAHLRRLADALQDYYFLNRRRPLQRLIHVCLQLHDAAAPPRTIARHDDLGLRVVDALAQ